MPPEYKSIALPLHYIICCQGEHKFRFFKYRVSASFQKIKLFGKHFQTFPVSLFGTATADIMPKSGKLWNRICAITSKQIQKFWISCISFESLLIQSTSSQLCVGIIKILFAPTVVLFMPSDLFGSHALLNYVQIFLRKYTAINPKLRNSSVITEYRLVDDSFLQARRTLKYS